MERCFHGEGGRVLNSGKKILIVDDNETVLMALEYNIQQAGYGVLKATDGERAFELVLAHSPDVIVSDITMPEMDGIELCKKIRAIARFAEIPFIFLTAHGEPDERVKGLRSGADDYIVKPFDIDELIARIDILYGKVQRRKFSATLSGNFEELSLADTLQVFAQTRKEGKLLIKSGDQTGSISFKGEMIMDAAFMEDAGEDALVKLLPLVSGNFHYNPENVTSGAIDRPINFVLIDTIRLIDEHCNLTEFIPDPGKKLACGAPVLREDPEEIAVLAALQGGAANGGEIRAAVGCSRTRAEVLLARLLRDGVIHYREESRAATPPARAQEKPAKILFVFTDETAASAFLGRIARLFASSNTHGVKAGMGAFLKLAVDSRTLHFFSLRGEKKFAFLWKSMFGNADAALFFLQDSGDREHLGGFREELSRFADIPLFPVTADARMAEGETVLVAEDSAIEKFFVALVNRIPT